MFYGLRTLRTIFTLNYHCYFRPHMEGVQRLQEVDKAAGRRLRAREARPRPLRAPRQRVPPRALQEGRRAAHQAQTPAGHNLLIFTCGGVEYMVEID